MVPLHRASHQRGAVQIQRRLPHYLLNSRAAGVCSDMRLTSDPTNRDC